MYNDLRLILIHLEFCLVDFLTRDQAGDGSAIDPPKDESILRTYPEFSKLPSPRPIKIKRYDGQNATEVQVLTVSPDPLPSSIPIPQSNRAPKIVQELNLLPQLFRCPRSRYPLIAART